MLQNTPTVYLSRLASPSLQRFLQSNGFQLKSLNVPVVYPEISTHADILLCQLGLWEKAQVFHGDPEKLTRNYPGNIRYNAVCTGKYFIHNLRYTDPDLLAAAEAKAAADNTILTRSTSSKATPAAACCLWMTDRSSRQTQVLQRPLRTMTRTCC